MGTVLSKSAVMNDKVEEEAEVNKTNPRGLKIKQFDFY